MKLDIHDSKNSLDKAIIRLDNSSMSDRQKKILKRFIDEMQIGKAAKKRVGNHRILSYIQNWIKLNDLFKKDLDKNTEKESEKFWKDLDSYRIKTKNGE